MHVHLQGNSSSYYTTSNSCLDSVLASRTGLPITLALLHAAVGAAAGLTVQLVGMPGHVINRALIKARGSQGSSSAGVNPSHAAGDAAAANSGSANEQQQADAVRGGSAGGNAGAEYGEVDGSWMYIDVFDGGTELSEDDLRCAVVLTGTESCMCIAARMSCSSGVWLDQMCWAGARCG